jgi:hypothetical protein
LHIGTLESGPVMPVNYRVPAGGLSTDLQLSAAAAGNR